MIAYLFWGIGYSVSCAIFVMKRYNIKWKRNTDSFIFYLLGIKFRGSGGIQLLLYCIASCFPAIIAGYFAKFVLDETFELYCNQHIQSKICDGEVCCQLISSHQVDNIYVFAGSLCSTIIAAIGFIRIIAWIVINTIPSQLAHSERQK
eukprot:118162_1